MVPFALVIDGAQDLSYNLMNFDSVHFGTNHFDVHFLDFYAVNQKEKCAQSFV